MRWFGAIDGWLSGRRGPHDLVERTFAWHRTDKPGIRLHLLAACIFCFLASGPVSTLEIMAIVLHIAFCARILMTWRTPWAIVRQPALWLLGLFVVWLTLSLAWSSDHSHGLQVLSRLRFGLLIFSLGSLIEHRRLLLLCWAGGFIIGHATQVIQIASLAIDGLPEWMGFGRYPGRISGWWGPVSGGTILCAVLGLHLGAMVRAEGRWWWIAGAMAGVTLLGIVLTGTRGAWLAGAALAIIASPWVIRSAIRRVGPAGAWISIGAALLLIGGAVAISRPAWQPRAEDAAREVRRALEGDPTPAQGYDSDTGARILMGRLALDLARERPLTGVGVGGYRVEARERLEHILPDDFEAILWRVHAHAHNAALEVLATTGVIGLALWLGAMGAITRAGFVPDRNDPTGYSGAIGLAMVGLLLASMFEPLHTGARTGAALWILAALAWPCRPGAVTWPPRDAPGTAGGQPHSADQSSLLR